MMMKQYDKEPIFYPISAVRGCEDQCKLRKNDSSIWRQPYETERQFTEGQRDSQAEGGGLLSSAWP
jgi:hypothetical protein